MIENKVANLLIKLRKNNSFTQADLSEKLGITFQAVSKWERGENLPDAQLLLEIAALYGITVDEILKGELIKKENQSKMSSKNKVITIIAIIMLILSPISIFIYGYDNYDIYVVIILVIAALSVAMILYVSIDSKKVAGILTVTKEEQRQKSMVYAACTGVFLLLGLVFSLWYLAGVIYVFGYAITLYLKK